MKTDLQKYKEFFDNMNIKYEVENVEYEILNKKIKQIKLYIDDNYIYQSYCNSIAIIFDTDEKFIEFEAFGD